MSARDRPDRRAMIVEASIGIAARGVRALSHGRVDAELGLPKGSTSYYFRTRHSMLEAVVLGIASRASADFEVSGLEATSATTPNDAARRSRAGCTSWSGEELLARYVELAVQAMRKAGGRFLARGNPAYTFDDASELRTN